MKLLFVLALLLCFSVDDNALVTLLKLTAISAASALKCYICTSKESMSDCDSRKKEIECIAGADRYDKMSVDLTAAGVETKQYLKDCTIKAQCDYDSTVFKTCKKIDGTTCEWDCCSGNLCNGGTAPVVSVFLMVVGALVALFR